MRRTLMTALGMMVSMMAHGQSMTPEQMQMQAQMRAAMMKAYYGEAGGLPPGMQQPAGPTATVSEEDLVGKIAAVQRTGEIFDVTTRKDGFVVNGRPYIDPEGRISRFAVDPFTGDAAYLADTSPGVGKIKWVHLANLDNPVEFGTARKTEAGWNVVTSSGKVLNGNLLIMIPSGVLVARQTAAFRYEPGRGVKSVAIPAGYEFSPLQHGAVGSTNTVLLEKLSTDDPRNPVTSFGKLFGRLVGAKADDYAFFNLTTGAMIPLNIDSGGKKTHSYSDCRRKNAFVNVCDKMTTFDSLYDVNGQRNLTHYYWRAYWSRTKGGSYAVVQENGLKEINIIDLTTGKRVSAFDRGLGIAGYSVSLTVEGKLRIDANWAFQDHVIDDAEKFFQDAAEAKVDQVPQVPDSTHNEAAPAK